MNDTAYERFENKKRRMEGIRRRNARSRLCPVTRWVDLEKPYCRAKEKQELRALLS